MPFVGCHWGIISPRNGCTGIPSRLSHRWKVATSRLRSSAIFLHESRRSSGSLSVSGMCGNGSPIALFKGGSAAVTNRELDRTAALGRHGKGLHSRVNRGIWSDSVLYRLNPIVGRLIVSSDGAHLFRVRARHATTLQHHPARVLHFRTYEEGRNMGKFNVTVDSFGITQTRSKHEDTNYIGLTLALASQAPKTMFQFQSLGNVNKGIHPVNLSFPGIDFDCDPVQETSRTDRHCWC